MWALHLSEVIAHPDGAANHVVVAKLVREARHLAEIKLWPNENVWLYIELNAGSQMDLEMA